MGGATMTGFGPATSAWFENAFTAPTQVQTEGWQKIASGHHTLLIAPTGSGKTLAAFLWCIDKLLHNPSPAHAKGVRVLYVSPLKALAYDVERNLQNPLIGIGRFADQVGAAITLPTVGVRTGDSSAKQRRLITTHPPDILVTTPESLYLMLGSGAAKSLMTVETVIVDEVHALAPTKRGAHLALSLERLAALQGRDAQRVGLSATAKPLDAVAKYLGGDRPVEIVDASRFPLLDLELEVTVKDMTRPEAPPTPAVAAAEGEAANVLFLQEIPDKASELGIWPTIYPRLIELIRTHTTTILFVNSRGLCERLTQRLNDLAGEELCKSHHGSVSHEERRQIEESLKTGNIRALVATSSLELGIDMGTVDLVVLVESPGSVARGLQRIGRAGHGVGQVSKGRIFPKHRGDLLEASVVAERMLRGQLESIEIPGNPLDVLAQQIVATVASEPVKVPELYRRILRAHNYRELPHSAFVAVLDMLSGRFPSPAFADFSPRINWDRQTDELTPRKGARLLALTSGGTIPDRGTYGVFLIDGGSRVGELDEEMVHETVPGQIFTLGASSWRVERITRDQVLVSPAPGEIGKLPFWRGDGPGRPIELGHALGAFIRKVQDLSPSVARDFLRNEHKLDDNAANNLLEFLASQRQATGVVPNDKAVVIERFRDELGDFRICILTPFGARVHAPWALAIESRLSAASGLEVQTMWTDDGIALRLADSDELPELDLMIPEPEEIEELVIAQLGGSSLFAGQFRENASRSLLMPKVRPGSRTPLWVQRLKSQELLAVAKQFPTFPVIMETYRSCLKDVFDLPALTTLLGDIRSREVAVYEVETTAPSPFARSLVFSYVANYLYEGDTPLAERRVQTLTLDRNLLRELLGHEKLRDVLDPEVIAQIAEELQYLTLERKVEDIDGLHNLLRRLGDLTADEISLRVSSEQPLLAHLTSAKRAVKLQIGGEERWIAIEDAGLYRDALGSLPPMSVPAPFLEAVADALPQLLSRYARTHGPFSTAQVAGRYKLPLGYVVAVLHQLAERGEISEGSFVDLPSALPATTASTESLPDPTADHSIVPATENSGSTSVTSPATTNLQDQQWCNSEILRRIKRRTLGKLRDEVAAVEPKVLGQFLPEWHGIASGETGMTRLREVIIQLEGIPLSYKELETRILPSRVKDFHPRMLDELGALGFLTWVGHGSLGPKDGRVALYRRDRVSYLLETPSIPDTLSEVAKSLLEHLKNRGASFLVALRSAAPEASLGDVISALRDLVWAGLITNDTFAPLRSRGSLRIPNERILTSKPQLLMAGGRWSLVEELLQIKVSNTERAHARAMKLLERHGVVCREVNVIEPAVGGFTNLYGVLKEMEELGQVRRGYFVEGVGGAQFALPGAVDRLRNERQKAAKAVVLPATDPANPYGWFLPWPSNHEEETTPPRRVSGATVVLVGGEPILYLGPSSKKLITFAAAQDKSIFHAALAALGESVRAKHRIQIDFIDGVRAAESEFSAALHSANFRRTHSGFERELA